LAKGSRVSRWRSGVHDTSYKGLPKGSVLSPFLYNVIGDDLVVYVTHRLIEVARGLIQTACTSLAVFFSSMGLTISSGSTQTKYVKRRCLQRINLLKSVAGVSWGAHPFCMLLLYRGLIGSVLEYGSVCYAGMAKTQMLLLERIQYRSTSNNSLGVLSGIPPLRHRLFYLNFRYLVNTFQKNGHPLHDKLEKLNDLSPQRCLIPAGFIRIMNSQIP
jgi:hypothetical protein